ncbi:hypothetical protein [Halobacillus campisalis]|uniref:SIR2-like domain-containing protein n=1 Tax=Halobacillus campisalis TaxID=435909 RepID=A0ABW2K1T0_9BACI|nr:hypothetical protein [Halobacillus campisalis]
MRKRRVCILAGNGLTIDLLNHLDLDIDTSSPLKSFGNPEIYLEPYLGNLSTIKDVLLPLSERQSDFDSMNEFLNYGEFDLSDKDFSKRESDLRRFLALAYSKLQSRIDNANLVKWSWSQWMKKNRKDIVGVVSFNYDLVLEKSFRLASPNKGYFMVGTDNPVKGVPFFKPHGSINFEIPNNLIHFEDEQSAWGSVLGRNQVFDSYGNGYITTVPYEENTRVPKQPDIIPPTQENYHENLGWVQNLFKTYTDFTKHFQVNHFVIVGHSYSKVDRKEIDFFISQLQERCSFYIVNPSHESESINQLWSFIESKGHIVNEVKKFGPPTLI